MPSGSVLESKRRISKLNFDLRQAHAIKLGPNLFIGNQNRTMHMNNRKMHKLKYRKARPEAEQLRRTILDTSYLIRLINIDKSKYMSRPKSGAAKSQTEATFYHLHTSYLIPIKDYPNV